MKRSGKAIRYTRSNFPKFQRAANLIGTAYKAYKGRSQTKTATKKDGGMQGITTFQKDVKQVYRYRRAPRKLRKRWTRNRRTFTSNLLKAEGSRKYHYHGSQAWTTTAGAQAWYGWSTYGVNGNGSADGTGDLGDVFTRLNGELTNQGTVADQNAGGNNSRRYYMDHMRARIVLTNTGTTPIFWEIFECMARKDIPVTPEGGTLQQFYTFMQTQQGMLSGTAAAADTAKNISAATSPVTTTAGVTPFQFRHFCQNFKVLKVTRLQAAAGNTVSFDASQGRNVTINWDNYSDLLAKKGLTKFYVVRQWGAVTSAAPNNSASSAQFEVERDYNIKVLDHSVPELNYFTYN